MRPTIGYVAGAMRVIGDGVNMAVLFVFLWVGLTLKDMAITQFRAAGVLPELSRSGLARELQALQNAPGDAERYLHLGAAWFLAVAAAGCGWMALLGTRWAFHCVLRALNR